MGFKDTIVFLKYYYIVFGRTVFECFEIPGPDISESFDITDIFESLDITGIFVSLDITDIPESLDI